MKREKIQIKCVGSLRVTAVNGKTVRADIKIRFCQDIVLINHVVRDICLIVCEGYGDVAI